MIISEHLLGEEKTHYLLFENWMVLICKTLSFFEQIWIPFTQGYFVPSLVDMDPGVLEKKILKFC